eukprot:124196-Pyramimonas_sp.AAC.1
MAGLWSSELPGPPEEGCSAAGSAACLPTVMSWLLAPAVGPALEPGLGARSRAVCLAAGASDAAAAADDGAAGSAGAGGSCPWLSGSSH